MDLAGEMGNNLPIIQLGSGRNLVSFSGSGTHICTLLSDSSVRCFGYNNHGQLGIGKNCTCYFEYSGQLTVQWLYYNCIQDKFVSFIVTLYMIRIIINTLKYSRKWKGQKTKITT